jgi:hypothetical protein
VNIYKFVEGMVKGTRYLENDAGFEHVWRPDGPPAGLISPGEEPDYALFFKTYGFQAGKQTFQKWEYATTGRYSGPRGAGEPQPDAGDPYRYARKYYPGGMLPWED